MLNRWQRTIVDLRGNVVPYAQLQVRVEATQAAAEIYRDSAGTEVIPNGIVTANAQGYAFFYAPAGLYRITSAEPVIDWRDVNIGSAEALLRSNNLDDLSSASDARSNLGLGTAATRDVVASATDTTAGRVPTVGWMGLGVQSAPSPTEANKDDPRPTGFYGAGSAAITPFPTTANILHLAGYENYQAQIAVGLSTGSTPRMFLRNYDSGTWRGPVEIYHSGNGVPSTRTVSAGTGLTGGGNLSANRTLSVAPAYWPTGVDQEWQNFSGQRALDTTYTNSTGRPITLTITGVGTSAGVRNIDCVIDGEPVRFMSSGRNIEATYDSGTILIPAGVEYKIVANAGFTITSWWELR